MDRAIITHRLQEAEANLAEATAVRDHWLKVVRDHGIAAPEGSTWSNLAQQFVPDDHEVVSDGAGGLKIQPRSSTASSGSQARP